MDELNEYGQSKTLPVSSPQFRDFLKFGKTLTIDKNYSTAKNPVFDVLIGLDILEIPKNFTLFHGSQGLAVTGASYPYPGLPLPLNAEESEKQNFINKNIPLWFMGDYRYSLVYANRPPTQRKLYNIWKKLYWDNTGEYLVPIHLVYNDPSGISIESNLYWPGYTKLFCYRPAKPLNLILITNNNMKKFIKVLDTLIDRNIAPWGIKILTHLLGAFYNQHQKQLLAAVGTPRFYTLLEQVPFDRRSRYFSDDVEFSKMMCEFLFYLQEAGYPLHGYIAPSIGRFHPEIMICKAPTLLRRYPFIPYDWRYRNNFEGILDSFRKYINKEARECKGVHRGDLYQHSIWTMYWMDYIIFNSKHLWLSWTFTYWKDNEPYLTVYKNALVVAALLHDIGKGGDINKIGKRYDDHPERGFEMLIGSRNYCRYNLENKVFKYIDFKELLKANYVESDILKLYIAVSVGMHYDFGLNLVHEYIKLNKAQKGFKEFKPLVETYLTKMNSYIVRYLNAVKSKVTLDQVHQCEYFIPLIEFCVAISAADVLGAQYFSYKDYRAKTAISIPNVAKNKYRNCPDVPTFFEYNNWNDVGVKIKNYIIQVYIVQSCTENQKIVDTYNTIMGLKPIR